MSSERYSSEILADYIAGARYDDIPHSTVSKAKEAILDALGCMIGGSTLRAGQTVLQMVAAMGGAPEATAVSLPDRLPTPWAAYVNAYLANLLDYDDTYGGLGHPGGPVIAAALAVGDHRHATGKDLISSVILGYETAIRIGDAIRPTSDRAKLVWGQGTIFVYGAAAAAGRLHGFDGAQLADTLTLAGTHAPIPTVRKFGYSARPLSWIKNNLGWASMGGVWSARLVENGFYGNRSFFDGETGFWRMASSDQWNREAMVGSFGESYGLERLSFKPYTSCRYIHTSLDGLTEIIRKHGVTAADVERVVVKSTKKAQDFADYAPPTPIDGQFSMPYVIAMSLLGVPTGHAWQTERYLTDPEVLALARRVHIMEDPEAEKHWRDLRVVSTVVVELKDGRSYEESVVTPKGDPGNPMSHDELVGKFVALAEPVVGPARANALVESVEHLENTHDISVLRDLLVPASSHEKEPQA